MSETEARSPLTLSKVEEVVNQFAQSRAQRHGLNADTFHVSLVTQLEKGYAEYIPGNPVIIALKWPDCAPIIKTVLDSAFRCITRYKLWRTMEVVPIAFYQEEKRLRKIRFNDISDLMDLVPKSRLRIRREETLTIRDTKTGETIKVTRSGNEERFDGIETAMWIELSRQVNAKYPDEPIVAESETPILDESNG